jgi:hypothetical protein
MLAALLRTLDFQKTLLWNWERISKFDLTLQMRVPMLRLADGLIETL